MERRWSMDGRGKGRGGARHGCAHARRHTHEGGAYSRSKEKEGDRESGSNKAKANTPAHETSRSSDQRQPFRTRPDSHEISSTHTQTQTCGPTELRVYTHAAVARPRLTAWLTEKRPRQHEKSGRTAERGCARCGTKPPLPRSPTPPYSPSPPHPRLMDTEAKESRRRTAAARCVGFKANKRGPRTPTRSAPRKGLG